MKSRYLIALATGLFCSTALALPWPEQPLTAKDAHHFRSQQFLPIDQHRAWQVDLDERGLRAAGSPAHEAYIDALKARLQRAGVGEVYEEPVLLQRWRVEDWSLELLGTSQPEFIQTANYVPYSGFTGSRGVNGRLIEIQAGRGYGESELDGQMVLLELKRPAATLRVFAKDAWYGYDPDNSVGLDTPYNRIYFATRQMAHTLDMLKDAGAKGAVIILDEPFNNALGLYAPYDSLDRGVPAVYVDRDTGRRLKQLAAAQKRFRLRVQGERERVVSRNLIGIIPGASDELVVLNSHTDGPNGIEDNGPNIIVAMAQYLSRLPKKALPRSVMILLTTGHFAGAQGGQSFVDQHQDDGLLDRMAALLCLEHMGAEEWVAGPDGRWMPSGKAEPFWFFMPDVPPLVAAAKQALQRGDSAPAYIRPPTRLGGSGRFHDHVWPGEGQVFWGREKIPTANYISGPNYLFNWGISTADKVDYPRLFRETIAFTEMTLNLARSEMAELRPDLAGNK